MQADGLKWNDLREWIALVESIGELKRVRGASSEEDIGDITELVEHHDGGPCVLFDEIPGFKSGYRVLSNGMGTPRRLAITIGINPAQASHERLMDFWRGLWKSFSPIPCVTVKQGAVLENVLRDDEVDLTRFPAPVWHPLDGGRYIATAGVNIMRDPDTGVINAGTYRGQVFSKNRVGLTPGPVQHGGIIRAKYDRRGQPCPVMMVVGSDPLLFMGACAEGLPFGLSELEWAGGVRGKPIEVIEGERTGLPIPAHAEIALEGFITTDESYPEGPYGEWMGYYQPRNEAVRAVRIERVYHRRDPILMGCPQGKPPHEDDRFLAYLRSSMIWDQLEKAGVPGVQSVWTPPEGGNRLMTVVALRQLYPGHAIQAGTLASQCGAGVRSNRLTVVVDEHVDVTSLRDVVWAILTRCDPARDVEIARRTCSTPLDMALAPEERKLRLSSRMIIDATTPFEWKDHPGAGKIVSTPERSRAARERWGWVLD